jgi:hypothetical protein
VALLLAGCGSRTGLWDDAAPDAATTDVPATTDTSPTRDVPLGVDAPVTLDIPVVLDTPVARDTPAPVDAGRCTWAALAPRRITPDEDWDRTLTALVPVGDGALVAWDISNDPAPEVNRMVQRVDGLGVPLGVARLLLTRSGGGTYGGVSLAESGGRLAALGWDAARGCRFIPLDATGATTARETVLGARSCNRLGAAQGGFMALETEAGASAATVPVWLSGAGSVLRRGASLAPLDDASFWTARRLNGAGEMLFAWMPGNLAPTRVMARPFGDDGAARGPAVTVAELTAPASRVGAVTVPGGYLLAWTQQVGPGEQQHTLVTAPVDARARPVGRPAAVAGVRLWRDAGFALMPSGGGVLALWVDSADGTSGVLRAAPLSAQGDYLGQDLVLHAGRFVRRPAVVPTPGGALVAWEGPGDTFRRAVYTQALRCVP